MKRLSAITAATAAVIWTASLSTPLQAQTPGGSGASGQAGSSQSPGTQSGTGAEGAGKEDHDSPGGRVKSAATERHEFLRRAAVANLAEIQLAEVGVSRARDPQVKQFAQMMVQEHTSTLQQLRGLATAQGVELPAETDTKHQRVLEKLSSIEADRFDRAFMHAMVDSHKDVEKLLKKQIDRRSDNETSTRASGAVGTSGSSSDVANPDTSREASEPGATGTSGTTPAPPSSSPAGDISTAAAAATTPAGVDEWASLTLPKVRGHLEQARALEREIKASSASGDREQDDTGSTGPNPPRP